MSTLTGIDSKQLQDALDTLEMAGVILADGVEADDVEDAVWDSPTAFRQYPFRVLTGLRDPEGGDLFALASPYTDPQARAAKAVRAFGEHLWELAVVPDTQGATAGSARVRYNEWDVADVNFNGASPEFELGILAAIEARAL